MMRQYRRQQAVSRRFLVLVMLLLLTASLSGQVLYSARDGVFDLREHPGSLQTPFTLTGRWEFYWGEILTPEELQNREPSAFIDIPAELVDPGTGVATLRTTILLPRGGTDRALVLKIPYFGSAYRAYANGRRIAEVGRIGTPPDYRDFRAQYVPIEAPMGITGDDSTRAIEIVIQVANFNHRRMCLLDISIGPQPVILRQTEMAIIREGIIFGSLLLLAMYHFLLYLIHRTDRTFLYFALVAFVTALREGIIGDRILVRMWPAMPAELMMKIGFSPIFLLPWLLLLYILALTPPRTSPILHRMTVAFLLVFAAILAFTRLPVYDWIFQYILPVIIVYTVSALFIIFRHRPFRQRGAVPILLFGTVAVVAGAINDYLRELYSLDSPGLFSLGVLVFLLFQAYFLALRLHEVHLTTERLQREAETQAITLEQRIAIRTRELEVANASLQTLSHLDPLTEIANRRAFEEALDREWRRCARGNDVLALVMVDVDMFKRFNDYYGHPTGDQCLRDVAETLSSSIGRSTDMIARYGGEEFVVLLPETGPQSACTIAERMRTSIQALAIPHESSPVAEVVTASFGVASVRAKAMEEVSSLIERADRALYQAKETGRNRVCSADTHFR